MSVAFPSLEEILAKHLPEDKLDKVMRILYGRPAQRLEVTEDMREMSRVKDFDLQKWSISALPEKEPRPPRKVSIALVQNQVVLPTEAPILEQVLRRSRITSTDLITLKIYIVLSQLDCDLYSIPEVRMRKETEIGLHTGHFLSQTVKFCLKHALYTLKDMHL